MESIERLLGEVNILTQKNQELLDATGSRFNIFRTCGVDHREVRHSAIIAEFLNPHGTHGVREAFLKSFVAQVCDSSFAEKFECERAFVKTEHSTDEGRMDILITDQNGHAIIIENKLYAGDQWEQLKRYNAFANRKYDKGDYKILYLTLWGKDPEEHSGQGVDYVNISYSDDIIQWLDKCARTAAHLPMVRETLFQYINHLKSLTGQAMTKNHQDELIELLCEPRNFEATLDIFPLQNKLEMSMANKFIDQMYDEAENLKKICKDLEGAEIKKPGYCNCKEDQDCLHIRPQSWNNFQISVRSSAKEEKTFYFGILPNPNEWKKRSEESFIKLSEHFKGKSSPYWAYYKVLPYRYWGRDARKTLDDGKMREAFKKELLKLLELIKDKDLADLL